MNRLVLTHRGKIVVSGLIFLAAILALAILLYTIEFFAGIPAQSSQTLLECVGDSTLQPDGSCLGQER